MDRVGAHSLRITVNGPPKRKSTGPNHLSEVLQDPLDLERASASWRRIALKKRTFKSLTWRLYHGINI